MRTHLKIDTTSLANSFLLLVMAAGALNIDLFGGEAASGYDDRNVPYRIELVFTAASQPPVLSISEYVRDHDVVEDSIILPSHFFETYLSTALFVIHDNGEVDSKPFYSSHTYARLFNIPHQNSDEDEAFILPIDVA
jgi:hypothetical protein